MESIESLHNTKEADANLCGGWLTFIIWSGSFWAIAPLMLTPKVFHRESLLFAKCTRFVFDCVCVCVCMCVCNCVSHSSGFNRQLQYGANFPRAKHRKIIEREEWGKLCCVSMCVCVCVCVWPCFLGYVCYVYAPGPRSCMCFSMCKRACVW